MSEEFKGAENVRLWDAIASIHGYNELAKQARTLGEKVYFRLARGEAEKRYVDLGGELAVKDGEPTVLVLKEGPPSIIFTERDIGLMREAVAEYDAPRKGFRRLGENGPPTNNE